MKALVRPLITALWLAGLAACTPTLPPSPTPLTVADANNPPDTPDYVVTVSQIGPPRWVYSLRYAGNFVFTAPNVLPDTSFAGVILHATHDVSQVSVQVLAASTPGASPPAAAITHCSPTDIQIMSQDASHGWEELQLEVVGSFPANVVYFGFQQDCDSFASAPSPRSGWAGPVAGP